MENDSSSSSFSTCERKREKKQKMRVCGGEDRGRLEHQKHCPLLHTSSLAPVSIQSVGGAEAGTSMSKEEEPVASCFRHEWVVGQACSNGHGSSAGAHQLVIGPAAIPGNSLQVCKYHNCFQNNI